MLGNIRNIDINKHFIHLLIKEFFFILIEFIKRFNKLSSLKESKIT
jgi:hypothetical protein